MTGPGTSGPGATERWGAGAAGNHDVELVGLHLRVRGRLALGRFPRLADLVNHNRGFIVLHEVQLLERGGEPTGLQLRELLVNQDDITLIGHEPEPPPPGPVESGQPPTPGFLRRLMIFTPGHTITGSIHIFREMTLANFIEAGDPRFLTMTNARAQSLIDPRALIEAGCMLVNRTQVAAIAEVDLDADPAAGAS